MNIQCFNNDNCESPALPLQSRFTTKDSKHAPHSQFKLHQFTVQRYLGHRYPRSIVIYCCVIIHRTLMMLSWKFTFGPDCVTLHWWQNMTRLLTWEVNKDWWSRSNFLTAMTSSEPTDIIWWQLCTELLWEMPRNTNSTWDFLTNKLKENDYLREIFKN